MNARRRKEAVILLVFALGAILSQFDRQSIAILKTELMLDLRWSNDDYASIVTMSQLVSAGSLLFAGIIVDRLSLRSATAMAVFGWSLAMAMQSTMRTFGEAMTYRVTQSVFQAISVPSSLRVLRELLPEGRHASGFAVVNAASTLGGIIAPLALPVAALLWGWRGTFLALGLLGIVWVLLWLRTYRSHQDIIVRDTPAEQPAGRPTLEILRDRVYWLIALGKTLSDLFWWLTLYWLPDFFHREFGLTSMQAGPPLALVYVLCALGSILFGVGISRAIDRGRNGAHVRLAALGIAILFVLPVPAAMLMGNAWLAAIVLGVALMGHQGFSLTIFAIIAHTARRSEFGRVLSWGAFCGQIGGTIIVKVTADVISAQGGYLPLFTVIPAAYVLSLLIFIWVHMIGVRRAGR